MLERIVITAVIGLWALAVAFAEDAVVAVPLELGIATAADGSPPAVVDDEQRVLAEDAPLGSDVSELACPATECMESRQVWSAYALVDALFLQTANTTGPLAVVSQRGATPGAPVLNADGLQFPTAPGVRVYQGWRRTDCTGIEIGYLGVWGLHADAVAVSPGGDIALPGQLGLVEDSGLDAATAIQPTLNSSLNGAELNFFGTHYHRGCPRHDPLPWRRSWECLAGTRLTSDWLLGVRWVGIDETANLAVTAASIVGQTAVNTTAYRVTSSSQLVGPQIGHRRRIDWDDWSVEGWAKVGLMGAALSQSQSAVIGPADLVQIREPSTSTRVGVGMIGDLSATLVRRLGDHWGLRAGYTLLWFSGVAPAAEQWDFSNTTTSGTAVVPGTVFLHGATLGVEATW